MKKVQVEKSIPSSTKNSDWNYCSTLKTNDYKNINYKPYREAVDRYKKLCMKTFVEPNSNFLSTLKSENLSLYLENFNLRDIQNINQIVGSSFYFRQIILAPSDGRGN
jgi:hypothetical protein